MAAMAPAKRKRTNEQSAAHNESRQTVQRHVTDEQLVTINAVQSVAYAQRQATFAVQCNLTDEQRSAINATRRAAYAARRSTINSTRRIVYADQRSAINAARRAAYARRQATIAGQLIQSMLIICLSTCVFLFPLW